MFTHRSLAKELSFCRRGCPCTVMFLFTYLPTCYDSTHLVLGQHYYCTSWCSLCSFSREGVEEWAENRAEFVLSQNEWVSRLHVAKDWVSSYEIAKSHVFIASNISCVGFSSIVCRNLFPGLGWTTGPEPALCRSLHSKASCATEVLCWQGEIGKRIPERYIRIFRSNQTRYAKPAKHTMVYATPSLCTLSRSPTSHVPIHNIITNSRLARRQLH